MPKAPVCKLCQKAHWSYEPHGPTAEVPGYVKDMARMGHEKRIVTFPDPTPPEVVTTTTGGELVYVEPVTQKTCNACNKPHSNRGGVCNACRQAAYRRRKA